MKNVVELHQNTNHSRELYSSGSLFKLEGSEENHVCMLVFYRRQSPMFVNLEGGGVLPISSKLQQLRDRDGGSDLCEAIYAYELDYVNNELRVDAELRGGFTLVPLQYGDTVTLSPKPTDL